MNRHADLFATWRIMQPPGAPHRVLMYGERVMAIGNDATLKLNRGYRYVKL